MKFDRNEYLQSPLPIVSELRDLFDVSGELTIFEIGACEGEDTIKYSKIFKNSKIYAFEPLPSNIKLIRDNLSKHGINNVYYFNKALSSINGTAEFFVFEGRPNDAEITDWDYGNKSSSLLKPKKHLELIEFIHFNKKIIVETITLESFCVENKISEIDFIHMDVQGAELLVLNGANDLIDSIKAIWLEVSIVEMYEGQPIEKDIRQFMRCKGFVLFKNCIVGNQGDQLYISKKYFPAYEKLIPNVNLNLLNKFLEKLRQMFKRD